MRRDNQAAPFRRVDGILQFILDLPIEVVSRDGQEGLLDSVRAHQFPFHIFTAEVHVGRECEETGVLFEVVAESNFVVGCADRYLK